MKRISYFMIIAGLIVILGAALDSETDWVQIMFGAFLCIGGYFTLRDQ